MDYALKIGVYSGSFNPPHTGHAILASYISQSGLVDKVWMMLTPDNPLKTYPPGTPSETQRMQMLQLIADGCPNLIEASDFELNLPRPNYTANTLRLLREQYPQYDFSLIIGADNWQIFDRWRDPDEILSHHRLIVYPRPGCEIDISTLPENVTYLADAPQIEISSTDIRSAITQDKNCNYLLPPDVWQYIQHSKLYR